MWTSAKIRIGVTYLDQHLVDNDYYTKDSEKVVGHWHGRAAERLGIEGRAIGAKDEAFERLRANLHPVTGKKLTPRTKDHRQPSYVEAYQSLKDKWQKEDNNREPSEVEVKNHQLGMKPVSNRISFFDFTCSAPKSLSVVALIGGDERLRRAHAESVKSALAELETFAACRSKEILGRLKRHVFTGEICAAMFEHDSSRALDPQLHTHCVIANATWDQGRERWSALTEYEMFKSLRYVGKVYQNDLASRVKGLGYQLADEHDEAGNVIGWQIAAVPKGVCEEFSRRRKKINAEIEAFEAKHGRLPTRGEISKITRESRQPKIGKKKPPTAEKIRAKQLARLKPEQVDLLKGLVERAAPQSVPVEVKEIDALQAAIAHGFERKSVQKSHAILADALNAGLGSLDLQKLKDALAKEECGTQFLANETGNPLMAEFCTKKGCELEQWSVDFIARTNNKFAPIASFADLEGSRLSEEQKEAVEFVCRSRNQVVGVRGLAGAGKSTLLKNLNLQLQASGREMLYLAPTASAVKSLQAAGFITAETVAKYLNESPRKPYAGAVIVVDEAGLESSKQGSEVLSLAQKHRQRVVFVGDSRQHVSVEAGDFLRALETHSKLEIRELKNIRRQTVEDYRQAILAMGNGQTSVGMAALDEMGWVHECDAEYLHQAASAWMHRSEQGAKPDKVIAVCPTWEENFSLSDMIRKRLKAKGKLGESIEVEGVHSLKWTNEQKRNLADVVETTPGLMVTPVLHLSGLEQSQSYAVQSIQDGFVKLDNGHLLNAKKDAARFDVGTRRRLEVAQGDQLLIRMNDKAHDLVNGQVLSVAAVSPDGSIRTECGKEIPATFRQFAHGYVVTSHKAQGRTARHVIVAAERLDGKSAYVGCSRGRESCEVFTPSKEQLFAGLPFDGNRRAALDVLKEQRQEARARIAPPPSVVNRIKKAGAAVARRVSRFRTRLRERAVVANLWAMAQAEPTKRKAKSL